ncbi:MAG: ATP-binding protein [Methanobacteriaceae archaeon]|nr:ATP-binding protein [Methanobacteriaceae archaeon]MDD3408931.1 ATP-binding protein [Methanobacteriaceae archaeon]
MNDLGITEIPVHRNGNICDLFSKTKYMEHVGSGISRMNAEMLKFGLPKPKFSNDDNLFKVILYGPNGKFNKSKFLEKCDLNSRQESALIELDKGKGFTIKEYAEMFNVSRFTASRDLNYLIENGLIRKVKRGNKFYFLPF